MSPDPELLLFLGLSSESVSEAVVSSSLMLDLVEDGVGGEVRGAPSTDLNQREKLYFHQTLFIEVMSHLASREWGELRPKGSRGLTAPAASSGGRNRLPSGEGSFSWSGRLWGRPGLASGPGPAPRPALGARYSL